MDDRIIEKQGRKNIVIRADGNAEIGAGHLMRCLTIAEYGREYANVVFWCADEASAALVRARGYDALTLGTDYRDMLSELPGLERLKPGGGQGPERKYADAILVDSYFVTAEYLQALGNYGRVYLLEDMPGHVWPVDGLINYNAFADRDYYEEIYKKKNIGQSPQLHIGAAYVPIRPQFVGCDYQVRGQVKELLVTTGGGDRGNIAGKILQSLEGTACRVHVVSGPYNPHGAWLARYAQEHPQVTVHQGVSEMAELMLRCDLAVTAGGTTVYELCALGVPFICFSYAENQEALAEYVGNQGIGLTAGKYHLDGAGTLKNIARLARQAASDLGLRKQMSQRARKLIDGQGARRLAGVLTGHLY